MVGDYNAFKDLKSCVGRDREKVKHGALSSFGLSASRTQYPPSPSSVSPSLFYVICVFVAIFLLLTLNMNPNLPVERVAVWS